MLAVTDEPAIRAQMHRISVETYHRLGEIGVIGERTELIRGVIIDKMARSPLHTSTVLRLDRFLLKVLPGGFVSRAEQPLTFAASEPEPDIAVVFGTIDDYQTAHPQTAALVMEVCVTSEDLDRVKLGVYAEAGIPECWLVLAESRVLERHTEPSGDRYLLVERAAFPQTLASTVLPTLQFPPSGLFPGVVQGGG